MYIDAVEIDILTGTIFIDNRLTDSTASFTLDVSGHVSERMNQESADRMNAYIKAIVNL